jgi:hypothetical protein
MPTVLSVVVLCRLPRYRNTDTSKFVAAGELDPSISPQKTWSVRLPSTSTWHDPSVIFHSTNLSPSDFVTTHRFDPCDFIRKRMTLTCPVPTSVPVSRFLHHTMTLTSLTSSTPMKLSSLTSNMNMTHEHDPPNFATALDLDLDLDLIPSASPSRETITLLSLKLLWWCYNWFPIPVP